jgi:hypothetical protein
MNCSELKLEATWQSNRDRFSFPDSKCQSSTKMRGTYRKEILNVVYLYAKYRDAVVIQFFTIRPEV